MSDKLPTLTELRALVEACQEDRRLLVNIDAHKAMHRALAAVEGRADEC